MEPVRQIHESRNYAMFVRSDHNRPTDIDTRKRANLLDSMERYGWLAAYPMNCRRINGRIHIIDGNHRFATAIKLGIPVKYVIDNTHEIEVAKLNNTQKPWTTTDYVGCYASRGNDNYIELQRFSETHNLPVSLAAMLLRGRSKSRLSVEIQDGSFVVGRRDFAERVALVLRAIAAINPRIRDNHMLNALMLAMEVPGFDAVRLVANVRRIPEALIKYGTYDGYLQMIETIYNFGRRERVPVVVPAKNIAASRNPANRGRVKDGKQVDRATPIQSSR